MPLSEHEQRMLEQIESALYAEDPKFASSVKRRRLGRSSGRRRLQAAAVFVVGLVLLVVGPLVGLSVAGLPVVSLIGFLVMFGAGLLALWGGGRSAPENSAPADAPARQAGKRKFTERMEERFNRRFDQE
ncbi:DUF3040 domain-containing protein [Gordonia jacobaea]|uniref:DUF3040 domain-containing protein n=1 Tax=Gordonia jacobaea TaxID=122202 RepID=UPI003D75BA6E